MGRRLDPEERELWHRVVATVRPLFGRSSLQPQPAPGAPRAATVPPPAPPPGRAAAPARSGPPVPRADTLDAGWDRRLARGLVAPDLTIDLHGHTLAAAHSALDAGLARALSAQARLVLLVTGRPPTTEWTGGPRRGAIRAAVGDWLGASRFADRIAAVRNAHPRHGGAGALYVVLRRTR